MPSTSKASRFFNVVEQREFALCQSINRSLRFRPVPGYFKFVSRRGDGWLWYLVCLLYTSYAAAY